MVRAVILAAGASSRMGRPKAGLPLTHRADTFLARILRSVIAAGLPDIVVLTGAGADAVRQAAGPVDRRVRFVHNPQWKTGQLSSLLAGLEFRGFGATHFDLEALLVTLVDIPFVSAETIARILRAWRSSQAPIVRPARDGLHGHPVLFDRAVFQALRTADPRVGAKEVVRAHAPEVHDVPVEDPGAFLDVDTEQDYLAALADAGRRS